MSNKTHFESIYHNIKRAQEFVAKRRGAVGSESNLWSTTDILLDAAHNKPHLFTAALTEIARRDPNVMGPLTGDFGLRGAGRELYGILLGIGKQVGTPGYEGEAMSQVLMSWMTARFVNGGARTFAVSPGLAQRLLLTRLKGITGDDIKLPFDTFYIEVPPELGFRIPNVTTGWHRVRGAYVAEDEHAGVRGLRVVLVGEPSHNEKVFGLEDDALSYMFIPLDSSLDDVVNMVTDSPASDTMLQRRGLPIGADEREELAQVWATTFQWLLALLFYITSPDAERDDIDVNPETKALWARIQKMPKHNRNKKRKRLLDKYRELTPMPRTLLGKSVTIDRGLPQTTSDVADAERGDLKVRTLVRGHWQRYAVGKGREERVWRFRQPFWRGDLDAGESDTNQYLVK